MNLCELNQIHTFISFDICKDDTKEYQMIRSDLIHWLYIFQNKNQIKKMIETVLHVPNIASFNVYTDVEIPNLFIVDCHSDILMYSLWTNKFATLDLSKPCLNCF